MSGHSQTNHKQSAQGGQHSKKDRQCQHKTEQTQPPRPPLGNEGGDTKKGAWAVEVRQVIAHGLNRHAHTFRTLDSSNSAPPSPPLPVGLGKAICPAMASAESPEVANRVA